MASRQTLTSSFHIRYAQEGEAACILTLSNEVEMVACDGLGNVSDADSIEGTAWTFYVGNTALDVSNYTYEVVADGCTVTTSVSGSVGTIAVTAMSADTATVTVKVAYNGTTYTREYTLTKNYANLSYHIAASPSVLKVDSDGEVTTSSLDFSIRVYDNGKVTTYTDISSSGEARAKYGLYAYYALGGTLYEPDTDSDDGSFMMNSSIVTQAYSSGLTLHLYQGGTYDTGTLVDQETLETVQDGSDGNDGNDGNDGEDAVTYSLLLTPSLIVAAAEGTLSSSTIAVSVIMAAGKSTTVLSTYSEITAAGLSLKVKANGSSTYSDLSSVSLSASSYTDAQGGTVMLCDEDGDVQDYQSFAILQEASSACNLLLSNEAAAVACDDEGNVTGSFQSTTFAFYVGAEDYTGYLLNGTIDGASFSVTPSGCTCTQNGEIITPTAMSADTATITVAVTYNGLEYTKVYTLTKVYAGSNGTSVVRGTCEGWWQTWAEIYSTIADAVSAGDTDATWLCNQIGETSSGTATASGAAYYATLDSEGNYTTGTADTGTCYICDDEDNEDQYAHVFIAEATGWSDLGQMTGIAGEDGEDADFYQLVDGSVADGSTAHASYAVAGIVYNSDGSADVTKSTDDEGNVSAVSVNEQLVLHLYVALQHIVGDTTSYVTAATVTASIVTDVGESTLSFDRSGNIYYYANTFTGLTSDDIPASILIKAVYGDATYYLSVPVTFSAENAFTIAADYFLSYYQNDASFSQLSQTANSISERVTTIEEDYVTSSALTAQADSITASVTKTLEGYVTTATLETKADSIVAEVKSDYSSAGLSITDDTIELTASKVYITDSDGNTVALFSDGKVSADLIDAESVFTTYLTATNAVLGNVTIEGSVVYAQHVLNKGTESTYLEDYTDSGSATFDGVTAQTLDVCTLDGTLVVEEDISFVLPYVDIDENYVVNSFVRGKTQFNSSTWREMSFSDFRRLLGRELTIINNSGASYIKIGLGARYFVGNDTTPTELTDGIYSLYTGRTVTFGIDYSTEYGYLWRASEASYGSDGSVLPEDVMALAGYYWDLPEECDSIDKWYVGKYEWNSSGTKSTSSTRFCPTSCITVPSGAATMSVQTAASKTIDGTTYHYSIDSIFAGTSDDGGASLSSVTTILAQSATELTGEGTLKTCGDGTVYRADVDIEGYEYVAVTFRVFTETASGGTSTSGYDGLTAENATSDNVDIGNLKILFY